MSVSVDPQSRKDGFEHRDANVKVLVVIGFGLLAALAVSLAAVAGLLRYYQSRPEARVTALEREAVLPPPPRLESDPQRNADQLIHDAETRLGRYAWVDRKSGIARIPLRRAQALLLERGWPAPVEARGSQDVRLQQARRRADPQ